MLYGRYCTVWEFILLWKGILSRGYLQRANQEDRPYWLKLLLIVQETGILLPERGRLMKKEMPMMGE